jgi:hypothetical protein
MRVATEGDVTRPAHVRVGFTESPKRGHLRHEVSAVPAALGSPRVLIQSIMSTDWDDTTGRFVQPMLRRALRRQIAWDGWWNWTPAVEDFAHFPRSCAR